MQSSAGRSAILKFSNESGLILGEINEDNAGGKAQFSFDNRILIERIYLTELSIQERNEKDLILERLVRDIYSNDRDTRHYASEILHQFIEESGGELNLDSLKDAIRKIVGRIAIEDDVNVGQNLGEGIYEFICLQKIDKTSELELIKELAVLDKDFLYSYLNLHEYLNIKEVSDFINDNTKWWNIGS